MDTIYESSQLYESLRPVEKKHFIGGFVELFDPSAGCPTLVEADGIVVAAPAPATA